VLVPVIVSALVASSTSPANVVVDPSAARLEGVRVLSAAALAIASAFVAVSKMPRSVVVASGMSATRASGSKERTIVLSVAFRVTVSAALSLTTPRNWTRLSVSLSNTPIPVKLAFSNVYSTDSVVGVQQVAGLTQEQG
jgi:hypothetical protein